MRRGVERTQYTWYPAQYCKEKIDADCDSVALCFQNDCQWREEYSEHGKEDICALRPGQLSICAHWGTLHTASESDFRGDIVFVGFLRVRILGVCVSRSMARVGSQGRVVISKTKEVR
jgi:hypothetical protein